MEGEETNKSTKILIAIVIAITCLLTGCFDKTQTTNPDEQKLIGKWEVSHADQWSIINNTSENTLFWDKLEFLSNKTVYITAFSDNATIYTWKIDNGYLILTYENYIDFKVDYKFEGDNLTLTVWDYEPLTFEKVI